MERENLNQRIKNNLKMIKLIKEKYLINYLRVKKQ